MTLLVHIVAGALGLLSGYVALYASKGTPLHRAAGVPLPIAAMTYWMRRLRARRSARAMVRITVAETAS